MSSLPVAREVRTIRIHIPLNLPPNHTSNLHPEHLIYCLTSCLLGLGRPLRSAARRSFMFCGVRVSLLTQLPAGIGAACAKALAEAGASLCLVLREPTEGAEPNLATVHTIRAMGAVAEYVFCDLSDLDAVKGLFQKALDKMGGQIHVLVNCAGIQRRSPSVDFSEGDWDDVSCSFTLA